MEGPAFTVAVPDGEATVGEEEVNFPSKAQRIIENSVVARRLIDRGRTPDPDRMYDVIVIGSGMGGGVVADQLSDAGLDVLLLEAGGLLFPTHT
jgi:NADPH-dependent 2,4-dienoyl-CoA reductase/sulfur reductase-like enzyme